MTEGRDHCPECHHKLHPQEMEKLFRGGKLDCEYCNAPLKARAKGHLSTLSQIAVGFVPVQNTLTGTGASPWSGYVVAGIVIAAIAALPPGLIQGAPWVRIVNRKSPFALGDE